MRGKLPERHVFSQFHSPERQYTHTPPLVTFATSDIYYTFFFRERKMRFLFPLNDTLQEIYNKWFITRYSWKWEHKKIKILYMKNFIFGVKCWVTNSFQSEVWEMTGEHWQITWKSNLWTSRYLILRFSQNPVVLSCPIDTCHRRLWMLFA